MSMVRSYAFLPSRADTTPASEDADTLPGSLDTAVMPPLFALADRTETNDPPDENTLPGNDFTTVTPAT